MCYPTGITPNDVAITSAGNMTNCRKLFHIVCPKYDLQEFNSCKHFLTRIINNCLIELKKIGYKSIAFPAIGTGLLNYPHDLAAKLMINTCLDFLRNNKTNQFDIQIIIFNTDNEVYEV
jgi:O-acetyl-ADP-ribose deacetylase (regulator of RNase III)